MSDPKDQNIRRRRFLLDCLRLGGAAALSLLTTPLQARNKVMIRRVRLSNQGSSTRIVFDLNAPVAHNIFTLSNPERVVIDLNNAIMPLGVNYLNLQRSIIKNIRYAARDSNKLRVVFDLHNRVNPRSFVLPPAHQLGHRLVIDLHGDGIDSKAPVRTAQDKPQRLRDVVIAIDAGHGGKDPGAIGRRGTKEKQVVLSIARHLENLLRKEKGVRPVMTRRRDTFLPLRKRIKYARNRQADMFISIHADAVKNRRVRGSSVYVLSENGASSEAARWLAKRENEADLVGGVSLDDKDDMLASVLLDLSQTATVEASTDLADRLLGQLKRVGRVHSHRVEKAGFAVLKSPDVPSVLVETAFISNPVEERLLRTKIHQQSLAKAILRGIKNYLRDNAPPGTHLAQARSNQHVIRRGESLSVIAARYQVDVRQLRKHNALVNDKIQVGEVLLIPAAES